MAQAAVKSVMFVWEGRDKQGKKVKGEMSGTSDALVKAMLRRQGISPMRVKKKPMPLFGSGGKKITAKDIAVFSRQLATMMSAGVPLVQSFEIVGKGHENVNMQKLILDVKAHVEAGNSLADALAKHPLHFDDLYVALVRAGEAAGILESLLDKIATYKEKTEAIKAKIKKALFYPAAVLIMAFVVTAVLMIFVIPQFATLFDDFG
ncbi:MAG: type II secretion system F family protein, partial [bacterium]